MAVCQRCSGEGLICDDCGAGGPIRDVYGGEYCQKCAEKIAEEEYKTEQENMNE